jgi:hypothetical protein
MPRIASTTSAGVPVDPTGGMTLDALMARQKEIAAARGQIAAPRQMISPWQGAAQLAEAFVNARQGASTEAQLAAGREALAKLRAGINLDQGPSADQIGQASLYDPGYADNLTQLAVEAIRSRRQREQQLADVQSQRDWQSGQTKEQQGFQSSQTDKTLAATASENAKERQAAIDAATIKAGEPNSPEGKIMGDFNAGKYGDPKSPEAMALRDKAIAKETAPAASTIINTGDTSNKLRQSFDTKEGELWNSYAEAGNKAAAVTNDMQILDELSKVAPQGPVPGTIQKMFPGASSAGAAFNAVVKRLAPQMRVTGSGSTSDIEYAGMVDSLPKLGNYPEANSAISGMIKAKSQLDMQRADIVTAWRNGDLNDAQARNQLGKLNHQSIMTPELRALIEATGGPDKGGDKPAGAGGGWKVEEVP